jgi:hypothetical protein
MRPVFFKIEPSVDSFFGLAPAGNGFFSSALGIGGWARVGEAG